MRFPQVATPVFWFYVAPYGQDRWILLSQDHPAGCTYESEGAAIRIAARAAELSYSRNGESAGVKVEHHGRWRTAIAYGSPEVSQHVGGPMRFRGEFVLGVQRISPPQPGSAPSEPFGQMKG